VTRVDRDLERRIDELFSSPPEGFTLARNALAAELRTEGKREDERRIRGLRRPSVTAWAANTVARGEPKLVDALLEAGAALRAEQQRALSGANASGLREASERRRDLVVRLRDAAAAALRAAGRDPGNLRDELAATFEAASVDERAGEALRAGRLERALSPPSGLGDVTGLTVLEGGRTGGPKKRGVETADRRDRARAERERARLERDSDRLAERLRAAEAKVETLGRKVEDARRSLEEATRALRRAQAEAREAKRAATRAAGALRSATTR
jgi:hypothetical protein